MNQNSTNGALMVMSNSVNNHRWFGGVSNYKNELTEIFPSQPVWTSVTTMVSTPMRFPTFTTEHTSSIITVRLTTTPAHLLPRQKKLSYQRQKLGVGDVIYRDWDSRIWQEGVYAQAEYQMLDKQLTFVLAGAANLNTYTRYENFYRESI